LKREETASDTDNLNVFLLQLEIAKSTKYWHFI